MKQAGVVLWLDCENLLPGQRWEVEINRAIKESSYVLVLLSSHSVSKRGFVRKELKKALDTLDELPPSQIFVIPARLDDCEPVDKSLQRLHWVDLFPDYATGLNRILRVLVPETSVGVSPDVELDYSQNSERADPGKNEQRLHQYITGLQGHWELLHKKLTRLREQHALETRTEEKFRLEHLIAETTSECDQIEQQL